MNSEEELKLVMETFESNLSELVMDKFRQAVDLNLPQFSREILRKELEDNL